MTIFTWTLITLFCGGIIFAFWHPVVALNDKRNASQLVTQVAKAWSFGWIVVLVTGGLFVLMDGFKHLDPVVADIISLAFWISILIGPIATSVAVLRVGDRQRQRR